MSLVIVFGAGINGAALARELVLAGSDVVVVDSADLAFGTTAYSSRLVHGGLRYLEFADTPLVRESLDERERLLTLAPAYVKPLEFRVPVERRLGGFLDGLGKLLFGGKYKPRSRRGLWVVRFGLWWYDALARTSTLPKSRVLRREPASALAERYGRLLSYYDAQMRFPEQFTAALLADAKRAADEAGRLFAVHTYSGASVDGSSIVVTDDLSVTHTYRPTAIVNAAGPWGDDIRQALGYTGKRLIGGTKGSHIVVYRDDLRRALGDAALYAEAPDGRPVFVIPFGAAVLIGTTDLPYDEDPADAVASEQELDYLINLTNTLLPGCAIDRGDVTLHYSGVRPLPYVDAATPAAITRRHAIVEHAGGPWPAWTLVGGKLTTCRALAEETVAVVLKKLGRTPAANSRERPIPAIYEAPPLAGDDTSAVVGTAWPRGQVRHIIRTQWVRRLEDLVERRLMLLFEPRLERATLVELAELLVLEGRLYEHQTEEAIARTIARLADHFGRKVS